MAVAFVATTDCIISLPSALSTATLIVLWWTSRPTYFTLSMGVPFVGCSYCCSQQLQPTPKRGALLYCVAQTMAFILSRVPRPSSAWTGCSSVTDTDARKRRRLDFSDGEGASSAKKTPAQAELGRGTLQSKGMGSHPPATLFLKLASNTSGGGVPRAGWCLPLARSI